ncbi:hypothetical protein C3432_19130 [Citrobacter amalonaticus]|uniref:Lipoprotein n=1 Tax=Citrobacter amalonaticus TaxID=35703 RepID=A0A2S4RXJ2_CITAM|nr:hypothetical protein [Citrobacter amalonaticus]POT56093.1 hypothetical protein C3432_19130 [Citrobacter amalonaticus]POT74402.1 hypothetical protein C3436_16770 [Citrobacter amalonaticus]POU65202.1 hypothetical protein C3430_13510 [Citrobacter amalonaticus]POV04036.1 hypothetical protein C3424_18450 [Citrobacter amalonaticus]
MKKMTPVVAFAALLVACNANAISSGYRAQLERSGCTQVTEADGTCDIHKTAAGNGVSPSRHVDDRHGTDDRVTARARLNAALDENVLAQDVVSAAHSLKELGFHQVSGEFVNIKGDHVTIAVDETGKVSTVKVKP